MVYLTTPNIENIKSRIQFLFSGNFHWFGKKEFGFKGSRHINPIYFKEISFVFEKEGLTLRNVTTNRTRGYTWYIGPQASPFSRLSLLIINLLADSLYFIISAFVGADLDVLKKADIIIVSAQKK